MLNWRGLPVLLPEKRSPLPEARSPQAATVAQGRKLSPGDLVGEYVVVRQLGEGGFGTVYEVAHPVIGKRAAVKVLNAQYSADEGASLRFVAEARAVNQIRHKNIVDIFSFGDLPDGRHYYVMELLEGAPLDAYLDYRGRLPLEEALPILCAIARALTAAHEAGLVHRDLKPENVFLEQEPEGLVRPKLLDFGMAKLLNPSVPSLHKTRSNAPIGSPRYMSPEQCRGQEVDSRTDVYAFGCVAYRLLSGVHPFDGATALEILMAHVSTPPVPPSSHCPELGTDFDEPVLRMLEKRAEARPQTPMAAYESLAVVARKQRGQLDDSQVVLDASFGELVRKLSAPFAATSAFSRPPPEASASRVSPQRARRLAFWGSVLAVTAVSAIAAFGIVWHRSAPTNATPRVAASLPTSPPVARLVVPPSTAVSSTLPHKVVLTLHSQPAKVDVYLEQRLLGQTPGPFEFEPSDTPVTLSLRAKGYVTSTLTLRPSKDLEESVTLTALARRSKGATTPGDLEDPY